jgi:formylmethanofuran dehydrogenase subunit E
MTTDNLSRPRTIIEEKIAEGDLKWLLTRAGELHGHYCPGLAFGVRAGYRAAVEMGMQSTGMEEVIAVVETNSCFSDGIQVITGCTFGNNALIYRDLGKTAFTLARRSGEGVRVVLTTSRDFLSKREPEAMELFQKVIVRREGSEEDRNILMRLWTQAGFNILDVPDDQLFKVEKVAVDIPGYAKIFDSAVCAVCGESIMSTRSCKKDGRWLCLTCAAEPVSELNGDGICLR